MCFFGIGLGAKGTALGFAMCPLAKRFSYQNEMKKTWLLGEFSLDADIMCHWIWLSGEKAKLSDINVFGKTRGEKHTVIASIHCPYKQTCQTTHHSKVEAAANKLLLCTMHHPSNPHLDICRLLWRWSGTSGSR